MSMWDAWIGRTHQQSDIITPALVQRFCATIDSTAADAIAPQGVHWCLCLPEAATVELGPDGHPKTGGFLPPIEKPRRMWAASNVQFHAPLEMGMNVIRRSTVAEISEKSGASGALLFAMIDNEICSNGCLLISERQTLVYRDAPSSPAPKLPDKIAAEIPNWPIQRVVKPSEVLLFRYSALTFNSHRIHYDQSYATSVEGYSGLVVHGPLIASLLLDLSAREFGSNALAMFSMRAVAPAFVHDPIHLIGQLDGKMLHLAAHCEDGRLLMSAEGQLV